MKIEALMARDWLPDWLLRTGIRAQLANKLRLESRGGMEAAGERLSGLIRELSGSPIALETDAANAQHYELPPAFFQAVLGPHMKYSSGYWPQGHETLEASEEIMLRLTCERAGLEDGQEILELGCGWGSLTLFMARQFPKARITAVSNAASQRRHIEREAVVRGLNNVKVLTADMNVFEAPGTYDRIVSVEMFEHMRNYDRLLNRIAGWLKPDGRLFVHIFCHREYAYPFLADHPDNWMARYFFTGGLMPSENLLLWFQKDLRLARRWRVDGRHYQKTCEAWLQNMDQARARIFPLFEQVYGRDQALRWWVYWRVFFMACAELFGYRAGSEWFVAHYLFERQSVSSASSAAQTAGTGRDHEAGR